MFGQKEWLFTGASGTKYLFTHLPKSEGLPHSAGVFILAYTHPRGHMAGWQMNPLHIGHSKDMARALEAGADLGGEDPILWNSSFVLLESTPSIREECAHDLKMRGPKYAEIITS
jgi:hypothetical protein